MADDLDAFFDEVSEVEQKALESEAIVDSNDTAVVKDEATERAAKKPRLAPRGVVVAAAASQKAPEPVVQPVVKPAPAPIAPKAAVVTTPVTPKDDAPQKTKKPHVRTAAGKTWIDSSLDEWPQNDFRIFVGNLAAEVTDEQLYQHFPSAQQTKIVRDYNGQSKGYGFVSFSDALECAKALREKDQTWLGSRPIRIKRSTWKDREKSSSNNNNKKKKGRR